MLSEEFENVRRTLVRFGEQLYGLPIDTVDFIGKKVKMRSGSYGIIRSLEKVERDLRTRFSKVPGLKYVKQTIEKSYGHIIPDYEIDIRKNKVMILDREMTREEVERTAKELLTRQIIQTYMDSGCPQLIFVYEDKKLRYQARSLDPLELFKTDPSVTDLEGFTTQVNGLKAGNTLMIGLSKVGKRDWKINFDDVHLIPDSPEILYYTPNQLERIRRKEPIFWQKDQIKQEDKDNNIGDEYIGYEGEYEK